MRAEFDNKNVLVTAGASGIGASIASAFRDCGASLHIVDINPAVLESDNHNGDGLRSFAYTIADVSNEKEVENVFATQQERFGELDMLVNCAGIKGPTAPIESIELEDWQRCVDVNLLATFLCCKHGIPMLKRRPGSSIVNISSTAGWHGYPLRSPYAASKWAVIGLTKSIAMELGPVGVRANVICPGSVTGERMDQVIADEAKQKSVSEDRIRQQYTDNVSLRTFINPEDIAQTALFLCSSSASKITGQSVSVDGHLESFA